MAYTLTLDNVTENYKNFIPELQMGIETKILSMRIKKAMDEGKTLEEIVSTYLPNVAIDVIKEDVAALEKGVNKVYAAQDEETDAAWVKSHLNECMLERSDKERVMFLSNIILAERVLHSDIELEEDALTQMKALREADACTAENVNWLLEIANDVLSQHAGMLTQMSWKAMEHTMFQLDYEILEENIVYGKESALAYAAAYYIQQACGKKLKIKNTMNQEMSLPAEVLGNVAAASVESSRLMQLYCTGKIEKKIFFAKINGIYKSVITFICEHKAALVVQTILTVGAFYYMFSLISILLVDMPVIAILSTTVIVWTLMVNKEMTYEIEEALDKIWSGLQEIWGNVKNKYYQMIAKWTGNAADTDEDIDVEEADVVFYDMDITEDELEDMEEDEEIEIEEFDEEEEEEDEEESEEEDAEMF